MAGRDKAVEITDLALEEAVERAVRDETLILTREGRPVAVVMAADAAKRLSEERELLRRLALGELESAAGEGDELSLVLEDCRLLLEEN